MIRYWSIADGQPPRNFAVVAPASNRPRRNQMNAPSSGRSSTRLSWWSASLAKSGYESDRLFERLTGTIAFRHLHANLAHGPEMAG